MPPEGEADDGVEGVEVAVGDERPGLVVNREVVGQSEASVLDRAPDEHGDELRGEERPADVPQPPPTRRLRYWFRRDRLGFRLAVVAGIRLGPRGRLLEGLGHAAPVTETART